MTETTINIASDATNTDVADTDKVRTPSQFCQVALKSLVAMYVVVLVVANILAPLSRPEDFNLANYDKEPNYHVCRLDKYKQIMAMWISEIICIGLFVFALPMFLRQPPETSFLESIHYGLIGYSGISWFICSLIVVFDGELIRCIANTTFAYVLLGFLPLFTIAVVVAFVFLFMVLN